MKSKVQYNSKSKVSRLNKKLTKVKNLNKNKKVTKNRKFQKGGNSFPSFESKHGEPCEKKHKHKILKTNSSNNLICKKSLGFRGYKLKTTLTNKRNGKPRYFHKSSRTKKCSNKYCWHRLSLKIKKNI